MSRLPIVGNDHNAWGTVLNDFLGVGHNDDGTLIGDLRFISVKDDTYGAAGDGITDDTTAVQAALDAANANGGGVFFPSGTYVVTGLTVPPQVVLQGVNGNSYLTTPQPPVSCLKLKAASTSPLIAPDDTGTPDSVGVKIKDLMLDTNDIAQPAINLPDMGASCPRFWTVERCLIVNSGFSSGDQGHAVYVGNLNTGCIIRDCQVLSNAAGVTTQGANGWNGIGWYGQDGHLDATFIGCFANAGLEVLGGATDVTFVSHGGGTFWNQTGVIVAGTGAVIDGMSIDHNYNDGAYVGYSSSFTNCVFHSNSLQTNNQWNHIRVGTASKVAVVACRQAPQSPDAGSNICAHFISAVASTVVSEFGNWQHASATLGTGWSDIAPVYTPTNVTPDRAYNANGTTLDEIADVLGTLIADLQALKLIA